MPQEREVVEKPSRAPSVGGRSRSGEAVTGAEGEGPSLLLMLQ
jgi:hypothetical protein